ncbi:dihydropteroate synthase [Mycolicibacterium sarraceniae]|uniref:dihydropteroate synthase n=1 Tax=Mycolicibacterium sarraceniae TaxID=1534348 RepID=A0A7I7SNG5_9MYCO|nr:dihydropteroate synthase [Mycolicibacterium sarraceniae]BBY57396.1 dihydropteroate synthase [Mycolicibacterium sarraceniae]
MGIVNVTPDSFWAESRFETLEQAVRAGQQMFEAGAWAVDIGGESTRPGAVPVSVDEELDRILPVVAELARFGVVAVDTRHAEVAQAAVDAGARIVNDVSGKLYEVAGRLGVGYVSMPAHTVPVVAGVYPRYGDVSADITRVVTDTADLAIECGASRVWVDPGIGFGKSPADNLRLLRDLPVLCQGPFPVLLGVSRKSFLHTVTGRSVGDRLAGSLAVIAPAWSAGVDIIRVHDVPETLDTIAMLNAIWG